MIATRPLGFTESMYAIGHDTANGLRNVGVLCHIRGHLKPDIMIQAFHANYQKHPLLGARYRKSTDGTQLMFYFDIPFTDVDIQILPLTAAQRQCPEQFLEEVVSMPYKTHSSLWRARIYVADDDSQEHFIVFGFHHCINDIYSTMRFTKDLLSHYQDLAAGTSLSIKPLPIPESLDQQDQQDKKAVSHDTYLKMIHRSYQEHPEASPFKLHQFIEPKDSKQKVILCDFDAQILEKLENVTQEHHIDISSLFNAALLLALYETTGQQHSPLHIAVNLRDSVEPPIPIDYCGCYIRVLRIFVPELGQYQKLTDLAKVIQDKTQDLIKKMDVSVHSFDLKLVELTFKNQLRMAHEHFMIGPVVSSWGSVTMERQYGDLYLKNIHRSSNQRAPFNPFKFLMAALNGEIYTSFNYAEPYMDTAVMHDLVDHFRKIIEAI